MPIPKPTPTAYTDGMVTVSRKRLRGYQHKFDWEAATTRYLAGDSIRSIAKDMGVSHTAIERVVNPQRRKQMTETLRRHMAVGNGRCSRCGGPTSHNYSRPPKLCQACSAGQLHETLRQKTHCRNGHPYDERNTRHTKNGQRRCRLCARDSTRRRRALTVTHER